MTHSKAEWSSFINHPGQSPNMHTPETRRETVLVRGWGHTGGDTEQQTRLRTWPASLTQEDVGVKSCRSKLCGKHIEK